MENKKLVKILLKDMLELEELIAEVKINRQFDELEMEFIHTRAKGVLQLLQLLDSREESLPVTTEKKEQVENLIEKVENVTKIAAEIQKERLHESKQEAQEEQEKIQITETESLPEEQNHSVAESQTGTGVVVTEITPEEDEMLEEEIRRAEANARLGDSFMKGKSVNDLITDKVKLEFKLSNRPVSSIQTSIGINDRFQYIRELFDGDNKKFLEAVKTLDSMQNVKEAVDYLRTNFKWKKNETSLKFVNLVKRRFQNS
jgi:hypothetical protein